MRAVCLTALLAAAIGAPALAQDASGAATGQRYLQWPGKAEHPNAASAGLRRARLPGDAETVVPGVIPHARAVQTRAPAPLMAPAVVAPLPAPQPAYTPAFSPTSLYQAPPPAPMTAAPAAQVTEVVQAAVAPAPVMAMATPTDRARIYSLHREYGEQPDRTPIPAPVYLDHLPVDLAAPPPEELRGRALREAKDADRDPDRTDGPQ